jgi:hypothetical protein
MNAAQTSLPLEIVAAITAALAVVLDRPVGSFVVKSIQPEHPDVRPASMWAKAGLLESHLARRQFGIRTR